MAKSPAQEILNLNYLLAELARWEAEGIVKPEQSSILRESYELKREELRRHLSFNGRPEKQAATEQETDAAAREQEVGRQTYFEDQVITAAPAINPPPSIPTLIVPPPTRSQPRETVEQRTLLERLADPHTIRILLYTGAAMLVVGIVIWLRDILYLKLQEPIVQAALLAIGTIAVTVSGWLIILRTRLRLSGRALTLMGSLLVPVNFWFLVRSGLIENNGRAWMVCALCALLYAHTAALLREKLYVYLASVAAIATAWTLVYRYEREALGLYALALTAISIVFLHLSRLFPQTENDEGQVKNSPQSEIRIPQSRMSYELWGWPLVHVSLVGVALAALLYMPWRLGSSPSFAPGLFRFRANEYDSSIAMLLFAGLSYAAWFAGRYIYTDKRAPLYITSALALFWTEFLALDGLQLAGQTQVLILAVTAYAVSLVARLMKGDMLARALHHAGLIVSVIMAAVVYALLSSAPASTISHSVTLLFIAATFAVASAPRFSEQISTTILAHAAAIFASAAFLVALVSFEIESRTIFFAACAAWPFVLYAFASLTVSSRRETQLSSPFMRIADTETIFLLLIACALTFGLDQEAQSSFRTLDHLLGATFSLLVGATLYGWLRSWREHGRAGAGLMAVALLVLVAAAGDSLKYVGVLPISWPVATAVIIAAFLLREAARKLLREEKATQLARDSRFSKATENVSRASIIGLVADCAVVLAASWWFAEALLHFDEGSKSAAIVLFLALLYWGERATRARQTWLAYVVAAHTGALVLALLIALNVEARWFVFASVVILFPIFFVTARQTLVRGVEWIARPARRSAGVVLAIGSLASLFQAFAHLQVSDPALLPPSAALGAIALVSFGASLWSEEQTRVRYFRAGLSAIILSFAFLCLHAGFDPVSDIEIYTTPVSVLLLVVAYFSARRGWKSYESDTSLLLWIGSLLLSAPLLLHALDFRFMDVPAPWRDLATLCASLGLLFLGVIGRLRAPLIAGGVSLAIELVALAVTSVDWLQIPLKVYLISVGALILLIWGGLEFRREQILRLRQRLNERREYARERFGEWR
ncbi:MAG TPA: hypothetical protein VF779_10320 [Pyrinomonadaceae bacterium]